MVCVWAFKPLKALRNRLGFVECDEKTADKLLKSGDVQNPKEGGRYLKKINANGYENKELTTKVNRKRKHEKSVSPE